MHTPQKEKEDERLNNSIEIQISEDSLDNRDILFKRINNENGNVMNIVISNAFRSPGDQNHPQKERVYVQLGYGKVSGLTFK